MNKTNNGSKSDEFDEMDELALSLQKQIQDLDSELDSQLNSEDEFEDELENRNSLAAEGSYPAKGSYQADDLKDDTSHFSSVNYNRNSTEDIKAQIQDKLNNTQEEYDVKPVIYRLEFLIPAVIGLFIIIGSASIWLLNDSTEEQEAKENLVIELPQQNNDLLSNEAEITSIDLTTEENAVEDVPIEEKDLVKPLRKIPLVYMEDLENQKNDIKQEKSYPFVAKKIKEKSLIKPQLIKPVNISFEHKDEKIKLNEVVKHKNTKVLVLENQNIATDTKTFADIKIPTVTKIAPAPIIGNINRQWINIVGKNINAKTLLLLVWKDKGKTREKEFSTTMKSKQLVLDSAGHFKLHINTGVSDKIWQLQLKNKNKKSVFYQFKVVAPFKADKRKIAKQVSATKKPVKIKPVKLQQNKKQTVNGFLKNQSSDSYTLQLLGSSNLKAIDGVLSKHHNEANLFKYKTLRDGKPWYILIYGSYGSKEKAMQAFKGLPETLRKSKPWVRNFAAISGTKKSNAVKTSAIKAKTQTATNKIKPAPITQKKTSVKKKELINIKAVDSKKLGFQLISLSSEKAMKEYILKHGIQKQSQYFERNVNGSKRYMLIYGIYDSQQQAKDDIKNLPTIIQQGKPWVRTYFDIKKLMN